MSEIDPDRITRSSLRFTESELLATLKERVAEYGTENGENIIEGICEQYMLSNREHEFLLDLFFNGKL